MAKRMLIDAAHPEETRVVVLNGNRLEEFDFETSTKKQIKGNIYLAKVTRVEPSLQAAFVEYGGNRHGFLAFSEIHPDYYRIPVADRQAALDAERAAEQAANAREERATRRRADAPDEEPERTTRPPMTLDESGRSPTTTTSRCGRRRKPRRRISARPERPCASRVRTCRARRGRPRASEPAERRRRVRSRHARSARRARRGGETATGLEMARRTRS